MRHFWKFPGTTKTVTLSHLRHSFPKELHFILLTLFSFHPLQYSDADEVDNRDVLEVLEDEVDNQSVLEVLEAPDGADNKLQEEVRTL